MDQAVTRAQRRSVGGRLSAMLLPAAVLLISLVVTFFAWQFERDSRAQQVRQRFEDRVELLVSALQQRMLAYEQVLRGLGSLLSASPGIGQSEWQTYFEHLHIESRYPGIQGVFYAPYLPAASVGETTAALKADVLPGWTLWPEGEREAYAPVIFVAPERQNRAALGYDGLSEPRRREAMIQARDTGHIVRTRALTLVTEHAATDKDFIVYLPIYKDGFAPAGVQRRRADLAGYASAVFNTDDLIDGLLGTARPVLQIRIYDGERPDPDQQLFGTETDVPWGLGGLAATRTVEVSRRPMTLAFAPLPAFFSGRTLLDAPRLVLVFGGVISLLLFLVTLSLTARRLRAQAMAERMTQAFRDSATHLGLLIGQIEDYAIFRLDPDGRISTWNAGAQRIFGYAEQDILGEHFSRFYAPEDLKAGKPHRELATAAEQGRVEDEGWRVRSDGQRFWVNTVISPIHDRSGALQGFAKVTRDMTERRRTDQERDRLIDELSKRLKEIHCLYAVADHVTQADDIADLLGHVVAHLPTAFQMPERTSARIVFKGATFQSEGFHRTDHVLSADIKVNDVALGAVQVFVEPDPARVTPEGVFLIEERELITAVASTLGESIDRRQKQDELTRYTEELEAFSYSVSHDLRAPLRAMDGFSHALADRYTELLDEQGRRYIERIRAGANRMGQLIDDLLRLSRITRAAINHQVVSLTDMARAVHSDLSSQYPSRSVELVVADDLKTKGDIGLLRVAMENLLGNAWKFTASVEHARIEVGQGERRGVFFIRDNGAGFDDRYIDKLFTPFQRLHHESDFPGTGIGLAIVQRVVHRHGGRIWAEGSVGEGATFYLELPAVGESDGNAEDDPVGRRQSG